MGTSSLPCTWFGGHRGCQGKAGGRPLLPPPPPLAVSGTPTLLLPLVLMVEDVMPDVACVRCCCAVKLTQCCSRRVPSRCRVMAVCVAPAEFWAAAVRKPASACVRQDPSDRGSVVRRQHLWFGTLLPILVITFSIAQCVTPPLKPTALYHQLSASYSSIVSRKALFKILFQYCFYNM